MRRITFFGLCAVITLYSTGLIASWHSKQNKAPTVKILEPIDKSKHDLNTLIPYRIKVSDPEDGESEYDEIATNEIFLEVRYFTNAANLSNVTPKPDPKGLVAMKKSNCFTCHALHGKLIAPSFDEIYKRYSKSSSNIGLLAKHIREGSSGVWGTVSMPTHPEISDQEARVMVNWILENAKDASLNYYVGKEGSIKLNSPLNTGRIAAVMLSASYIDHGTKTDPQRNLNAKDVIVLYSK